MLCGVSCCVVLWCGVSVRCVFKIFVGASKIWVLPGLPSADPSPRRLWGCRGFTRQPENSKRAHLRVPPFGAPPFGDPPRDPSAGQPKILPLSRSHFRSFSLFGGSSRGSLGSRENFLLFVLLVQLLLLLVLLLFPFGAAVFHVCAAVWCSLLFVQLVSACAAPVVCAAFPVLCAAAFCCFCRRPLNPPLPLLTFQMLRTIQLNETTLTSKESRTFSVSPKNILYPKKISLVFCTQKKTFAPKKSASPFC